MDQLLKKLLEAQILSEDTKAELEIAITAQLDEAIKLTKAQVEADTKAELTQRWADQRDDLIMALDEKVGTMLTGEIAELKEDIERFRDLEKEYGERLVEAKKEMKVELKRDLKSLVEKLDSFLEIRLSAEIEELKEDIAKVRENDFGRRVYESFIEEFRRNFVDETKMTVSIKETEARLAETAEALEEAESTIAGLERKIKMDKVLKPLSGKQREVMEAILKTVKTENLEEGYKTFIGRVIRESDNQPSGKEKPKVLAEGNTARKDLKSGKYKTGDTEIFEQHQPNVDEKSRWRSLAGV